MNRVYLVQSVIVIAIAIYVVVNIALKIYPSYAEGNYLGSFLKWTWLGIFICPAMIIIYTTLEVIFPKEYNIANDEYARHVRTQSMVFGFITVLLTYCICVILLKYGNMVMQDAIFWIGNSFASPIIFIAWKSIGDLLGNVKKQH